MKKKIIIVGAGGHGKVVLDILLEAGRPVLGFVDDDPAKKGKKVLGYKVLGGVDVLSKGMSAALGIGDNRARGRVYDALLARGVKVESAIHPKAAVSRFAKLGPGVAVVAGAAVNPDAVLAEGVVVNTGAGVDHDCRLEKFCQIWPGAHLAGNVQVGAYAYVGTGASVVPGRRIGAGAVVGAGAAVVRDVPDGTTAAGVPAESLERKTKT